MAGEFRGMDVEFAFKMEMLEQAMVQLERRSSAIKRQPDLDQRYGDLLDNFEKVLEKLKARPLTTVRFKPEDLINEAYDILTKADPGFRRPM